MLHVRSGRRGGVALRFSRRAVMLHEAQGGTCRRRESTVSEQERGAREPMSKVDHGMAAHGAADQPHDDHRRADVRRSARSEADQGAARRALPRVPALPPEGGRRRQRRALETDPDFDLDACASRACPARPTSSSSSASSASWPRRRRWTCPSRCSSSTSSRTTPRPTSAAAACSSRASTTATRTASALVQVLLSLTDTAPQAEAHAELAKT